MTAEHIYLRALEPPDVDLLYQWENDPSLWHLGSTLVPFSRFLLEQYVMSAEQDIFTARQLRLMIVRLENNQAIGTLDLFDFEPHHRRAAIGIMIQSADRGKGYASEALELLIEYSFKTLNLHQLHCVIATDNEISINLFQKFGFEINGKQKQWMLENQQWKDVAFLQLINHLST